MPRNYQRTTNNPYLLPHNLYMRVLYLVRDYDRLSDEYFTVLNSGSSSFNSSRKASGNPSPTENKAIRLASISAELNAIDKALYDIPPEYRDGVKQNVIYNSRFPINAGVATYKRHKQRFIFNAAKYLKLFPN